MLLRYAVFLLFFPSCTFCYLVFLLVLNNLLFLVSRSLLVHNHVHKFYSLSFCVPTLSRPTHESDGAKENFKFFSLRISQILPSFLVSPSRFRLQLRTCPNSHPFIFSPLDVSHDVLSHNHNVQTLSKSLVSAECKSETLQCILNGLYFVCCTATPVKGFTSLNTQKIF